MNSLIAGKHTARFVGRSGNPVYRFSALDNTGRRAYYFILLKPDEEAEFLARLTTPGEEMLDLSTFGEVLGSCYGDEPTPELLAHLRETYKLPV